MTARDLHAGSVLCFLAGFAVMDGEIAAARLVAPYYGTSTAIWSALIGSVLLSLALGNLLGGWWSRRGAPRRWLWRILAVASVLLALLPRIAPRFMAGSLAAFRGGDVGRLLLGLGAVSLLVSIPTALLGAVPPLALHAIGGREPRRGLADELGRLSGRLGAAGTLGSLAGAFGAGLLFIPWLGTRHAFDLGAAVLALGQLGVACRMEGRRTLVVAALVGAVVFGLMPVAAWAGGYHGRGRLIWEGESRYNHIAVTEQAGLRELRVNEGFAVQSLAYDDGHLPLEGVWAYYALAPRWGRRPRPRRVLLLGLGGGTSAEIYRALYPGAAVTGVEIDPEMVRAGEKWLGIDLSGVHVVIDDARTFVAGKAARAAHRYDVVVLDAFQFPYIPFQLTTREFFRQVARILAPGGVFMMNAGRYRQHRDVVDALARTLSTVFPHVEEADAPNVSNTILVGTMHAPGDGVGLAGLDLSRAARVALRRAAAGCARLRPATWPAGTPLLEDDHAPVEWLTDRIVLESL